MKKNLFYLLLSANSHENKTELETETLPYAFKSNGHRLRNYRIYGAEGGVGDLVTDTESEYYGKYAIPIKIEGKNIAPVSGVPSTLRGVAWAYRADGAVTGTRTSVNENLSDFTYAEFTLSAGSYIFTRFDSESANAGGSTYQANIVIDGTGHWGTGVYSFTINDTATIKIVLRVYSAFDGTAIFKPMICKATVADGTFEPYQEPKTHNILLSEPLAEDEYIDFREQRCYRSDNTSEIISLPALPSIDGTNVLLVNTTVQPEKVYVQGNIEEIVTASLQTLNTNLQNLQTDWKIENSLDVMPIERPNLQLNDISETVGGEEVAE